MWAIAVTKYFFGAMRWTQTDLKGLDQETRRIMRRADCHQRSAALEKLYLPRLVTPDIFLNDMFMWVCREKGGRGLMGVKDAWEREAVSAAEYLIGNTDPQVKGAVRLQQQMEDMGAYSYIAEARQVMRKYELDEELTTLKEASNLVKTAQIAAMWKRLEEKKMHSIYDRTARRGRGTDRRGSN